MLAANCRNTNQKMSLSVYQAVRKAKRLAKSGDVDQAAALYKLVLEKFPKNGSALKGLLSLKEHSAPDHKGAEPAPTQLQLQALVTLFEQQKMETVVEQANVLLKKFPKNDVLYNILGVANAGLGRQQETIYNLSKALQINPYYADAHYNLSKFKRFHHGDPQIDQMTNLIDHNILSDKDRIHTIFGLGKAMNDLGREAEAFAYYSEGNRLRRKMLDYDISSDQRLFDGIRISFDQETPAQNSPNSARVPFEPTTIFIVGMPRSGTTLVEQILACHSCIEGAGELELLEQGIADVGWSGLKPDSAQLQKLGKIYRSGLTRLSTKTPYITDKMPNNFRWIGFIQKILPEVKIINVERDARATCWSIFKHNFRSTGNGFAYDLIDIADYYALYLKLMAFWNQRYPNKICNLNYERLTENQEDETRKLFDYIGLKWEDQCLEFYKYNRVVETAASIQVRQKMYTGSSNDWRKYEEFLRPMLQRLEKHGIV